MSEPNVSDSRPTFRRPIIRALVGGTLMVVAQLLAPVTDYQYAFFATALIGVVTTVLVLFGLQRVASAFGRPWVVPIVSLLGFLTFGSLVRMKTLSGEMVPQLEWRFASRQIPELQRPLDIDPNQERVAEAELDAETGAVDPESASQEESQPNASQWVATWGQFLGNNRNGILAKREFGIPSSSSDVEEMWNIGVGGGWSSFAVSQKSDTQGIAITLEQRDERECVTAYDLMTGKLLWLAEHEALHFNALGEGGPRTTPSIMGNRVYAQGATGFVWCLDLETGTKIWTRDLLETAGWDQLASEIQIAWGRSGSPLLVDGLCVLPFWSR